MNKSASTIVAPLESTNEYKGIHDTTYRYDDEYTTSSVARSTLRCCASGFVDRVQAYT